MTPIEILGNCISSTTIDFYYLLSNNNIPWRFFYFRWKWTFNIKIKWNKVTIVSYSRKIKQADSLFFLLQIHEQRTSGLCLHKLAKKRMKKRGRSLLLCPSVICSSTSNSESELNNEILFFTERNI